MHLRKLVLGCGLALALLSNLAVALGLGEVRLNSTLNEPLDAEIKLLDTRGLSSDQIIVALASPADFERNGVDRLYFFTEFQFEVLLNQPDGALVRITSRNPVREPYINFLVEARWPTGRLLREYTLLMDLPTFADTATAPVQSPSRQPAASGRVGDSASRPASQPRATSPVRETTRTEPVRQVASGDSYTVSSNDTLWQIALDIRPDSSHSVHQTMLAIQRLNPDAFIDNNINLLRKGQVLRIPSSDDILSVSRREAVNDVARQNQAWADDSMGAQLSASRRDAGLRRESGPVSGSVKLATPSSDNSSGGQGSGDNTGSGRALESELASTLEELDKTKSENSELSSRVRDLEEQIETMERLVEVSNEQLRALQLGAAQTDQAADEELGSSDSDVASDLRAESDVTPAQETNVEPVVEAPVAAPVEPAPVVSEPAPSRTVVSPPAPKTLVDHLMEHLLWVIGGVVALLGVVAFIIYRGRQNAAEEDYAEDNSMFAMETPEQTDDYEDESLDFSETEDDDLASFDEDEIPAEAETGDVVGEADIYIAYGKFDQAEEMLLNGLAKEPDSIDVRLKLLEVYSQTQDAAKFDQYYAGLLGIAGAATLARAAELRSHIVDAGDFNPLAHERVPADESIDIATEDSISLDDELSGFDSDSSAESESPFADSEDLVFEDDLDFSLDLEDDSSETDTEESLTEESDLRSGESRYDLSFDDEPAGSAETDEDELALDFDLDDDLGVASEKPQSTAAADSELSFSLDDDDITPTPAASGLVSESEEDFSFDFDEEAPSLELREQETVSPEITDSDDDAGELRLPEDVADDFNLDMDVEGLDLAALDQEMESLEADFDEAEASELQAEIEEDEADSIELDADLTETLAEEELEFDEPDMLPAETAALSESVTSEDDVSEDDVFDRALSEFSPDSEDDSSADMSALEDLSEDDMDAELDFLADADEAATKLDLARAYIDMGDTDGARDILAEVAHEGNEQQREEAAELLGRIDA